MQRTRVSVGSVTTVAVKCEMRSIVIIIELSYRIVIMIILIIVSFIDQKQYLTYRNSTIYKCHSTRDYIAKMLKNAIYIFGYNGLT